MHDVYNNTVIFELHFQRYDILLKRLKSENTKKKKDIRRI